MPCSDISEVLQASFDSDSRLRSYRLAKQTCGAPVGDASLLLEALRGTPLDALLDLSYETIRPKLRGGARYDLLVAKHLDALRGTAAEVLGAVRETSRVCTMARIEASPTGALEVEATVALDLDPAGVRPCGGCNSCGS